MAAEVKGKKKDRETDVQWGVARDLKSILLGKKKDNQRGEEVLRNSKKQDGNPQRRKGVDKKGGQACMVLAKSPWFGWSEGEKKRGWEKKISA